MRFLTVTMDKYAIAFAEKRRNNRKQKAEQAEQQPVAEEVVNEEPKTEVEA